MLTLEVVLSGILLGGLYACMAMGFSVIWGVTNLINLAHGSMIIVGAYVTWALTTHTGIDPFLTLPVSAATLFVLGYALQRLILNRVIRISLFMSLVFTFGLNMLLVNVNLQLFSADVRSITMPYSSLALDLWGIRLPYTRIGVCVLALALTGLLYLFMNRTRLGNAIRAVAQNERAAAALGVKRAHVYAVAFGIGAALAGAAGTLTAALYSFSPVTGDGMTMKAFVIVLLGGLGSMSGVIVAAMVLAVAENLVSALLAPGLRDAVSFFFLLALLLLRPRGLFGHRYLADAKAS
jgi:branched-chain amino acid transport system permease protein